MVDGLSDVLLEAQQLGFLGPGPIGRHISLATEMAEAVEQALEPSGPSWRTRLQVLDLGTGGGVPGLVLSLRWPWAELWLLDASSRRAAFLERSLPRLGVEGRVTVLAERAEQAGRGPLRGCIDVVTARSFAAPAVTAECGAPFLRVGGLAAISEPPAGPERAGRWSPQGLAELGMEVVTVPASSPVQILRQCAECPTRFPRRDGVPAKRPLF